MVSVGLGALLEGLRVSMKDTDQNRAQGIAGKSGTVMGTGQPIDGRDAGEIYIQVRPDGEDAIYSVLPRDVVKA